MRSHASNQEPQTTNQKPGHGPESIGDILQKVARRDAFGKKALSQRRKAQKVLSDTLGPLVEHASVSSVKSAVVTIVADSAPLFQELESFHRQRLTDAFRQAGLKVREIRVTLAQ